MAGQLDLCLQHPEVYTPVLVGFNPAHQARFASVYTCSNNSYMYPFEAILTGIFFVQLYRDEPIPGSALTFYSVVQRMQELAKSRKAFLINPAVGVLFLFIFLFP